MAATTTVAADEQSKTMVDPAGAGRLFSLDVFRGLTVGLMILVNDGEGPSFHQLEHSTWNGWTLTDLVFPFFLFITGVSLTFSFSSRLKAGTKLAQLPHIVRRALIIFAIGLLINGAPHFDFATWRVYGVLQRIAIGYLVGSVLYLWCSTRVRWAVIAGCLLGYWALMRWVPVPGYGVPGVDIPLLDMDRNWVAWLDRKLLPGHLYEQVRDPEGLLSTIPALATALLGVAAGEWIRALRRQPMRLLRRLAAVGALLFAASAVWDVWFPINKKLWTSSYVLMAAGLAMLTLAACYWLVDVKQWRGRWTVVPLVFGTNTIFAYALSEFGATYFYTTKVMVAGKSVSLHEWVCRNTVYNIPWPHWTSLTYALSYTAVCWAATWLLYRKKIFLKV
ncbi:MAG: heparan-alpha-glucosaminide N-acetyltransferase domain-containing protein [Acidobacteriota bacterium]|nr:heparan-alpha-glucosaminide N-acetyltransferase domain-containing protein [Acidobacteriota bacterium]